MRTNENSRSTADDGITLCAGTEGAPLHGLQLYIMLVVLHSHHFNNWISK
jgi:hypothetical protein